MSGDPDQRTPEFAIAIDGQELDQGTAEDVIRIVVEEEIGRLASATVHLRNWDPESDAPDSESAAKLEAGRGITIRMGYDSELSDVFEGLIVAAVAQVRRGGLLQLELRCRCNGIKLVGTPRFRVWTDQTDLDAVTSIGSDLGLEVKGTAQVTHPFLVQHRLNDWSFVLARASALGLQPYVRGTTLNFAAAAADGDAVATLEWGENLMEFDLQQDLTSAWGGASTSAWDPESKAPVQVDKAASAATIPAGSRPDRTKLLATAGLDGARSLAVAESIPMDQAELDAWGQGLVDRGALDAYQGTATATGDDKIRIDALVDIAGLGSNFDGSYYVTRVRHRLTTSGFETTVGLGTTATPWPGNRPADQPVVPRMDSLVVAKVISFEDSDRKQGRVQVSFPWLDEEQAPVWARLATPGAGAARGFVFVPEPDDEVLVQFVDGDPRHPVVVGSLWNGVDAPPADYDAEKNDRRALVSRSGHHLVFDDGDDAPSVMVETAAGQKLLLDDTSGSEQIAMTDKAGNEVVLDSSGIALTAAAGTKIALTASGGSIELSANEITATADTNASVKGNTGVTVESSGSAEIKGLEVNLSGNASIAAKAPIIKLN